MTKGHEETFGSHWYVHYLDCGGGFRGVCVHQNSSNCSVHHRYPKKDGEERVREERKGKEER